MLAVRGRLGYNPQLLIIGIIMIVSRSRYLWLASVLLLFTMLGGRELWTQEHRWADIVSGMFFRHDFLHPYLGSNAYYDKPLLSYWLIAIVASITHELNTWALRFPSALAGLLAIFSIYKLGTRLKDQGFGLLCGWLLLTTFHFIFWARVSSADMLNLAGSLFAVYWYFEKREQVGIFNYMVFFLILAITSLCKGLGGAAVALLAILPDMLHEQSWKKHLRWLLIPAGIPALFIYALPFWLSSHFGSEGYHQNGLYLVYRENFLRYFQPFDHKDPFYIYFIYLPIYLLPWALFFIPALWSLKSRWRTLSWHSKWMVWGLFSLFIFFTLSGSRRNYYVLPLVPFGILMTADWLYTKYKLQYLILFFFVIFLGFFGVAQPLYYAQGGHRGFLEKLKQEVASIKPLSAWQFVLLDPESKIAFYLHLPPQAPYLGIVGDRQSQTVEGLIKMWPILKGKPKDVIFISRKQYAPALSQLLPHYRRVEAPPTLGEKFLHKEDLNASVAFIPN